MTDRPTHSADPPADAEPIDEPTAALPALDPSVRTPAPGSRIVPSRMARAARASEPPPAPVADAGTAQTRVDEFRDVFSTLRAELGKVIVGQSDVVEEILIALFAGGHVLIEGVPGTGKTLLVRTLAQALNLSFNRIQFTIDLMPADITGTRMLFEQDGQRELVFAKGPIFSHVLLADEINRATPKTQSALLEAMAERQVTVAGSTHKLSAPFFVLATLNPIEMEGTYPLPEAQLDRFLFKVFLPYPSATEMQRIIGSTTGRDVPQASAGLPEPQGLGPCRGTEGPGARGARRTAARGVRRERWSARRSRAPRSLPPAARRRCRPTSTSPATSRTGRARAAARHCCSAPRCAPCSPDASTSATTTSTASPCRR